MKVKFLVNCRDQNFLQDMFVSADRGFRCLSTSEFNEDIIRHAKYTDPDVFLTVAEEFDYNMISQYSHLKKVKEFSGTLFALTAPQQVCDEYKKHATDLFGQVIPQPAKALEVLNKIAAAMGALPTEQPEEQVPSEKSTYWSWTTTRPFCGCSKRRWKRKITKSQQW